MFEGVQGYTFSDVPPRLARAQLQPVLSSVHRTGDVIDSVSKEAIADGERTGIIATVVVVEPKGGKSSAQAFQAVLRSIIFGPPRRAAGGQAFAFSALGVDILLAPIAVEPALLLLSVAGVEGQPTEDVTEQILRANS